MQPLSKVLVAEEVPATPDIADVLELLPGELVFYLYRVRYADGEPMAIEQTWVPSRLMPGLFEGGAPESIYGELRRRGLDPDWGEGTVSAAEVDAKDAELLGLRTGKAVLRLAWRTFAGEIACAYSRSSYRSDRYELWVPLRAPRRALTPRAPLDGQPDNGGRSESNEIISVGQVDDARVDRNVKVGDGDRQTGNRPQETRALR
jgi:GntR family transcriptional regulator